MAASQCGSDPVVRHPMLFPFLNFATARDAVARTRLELFREGSGEEVVGLKYQSAGVRCGFRRIPITDSDSFRSPIPTDFDQ